MGWSFGNNPASVPCLHEMAFFPLVQAIYGADSAGLPAVVRQIDEFGACGWDDGTGHATCAVTGQLMQRWAR